jgi:hypothetical protein
MSTADLVVVLGAVCGVLMVLGGLLLFYKGIVTLKEASAKSEAFTIELKNILKLQSRYPAYGFFAFGLAFIALAVVYARPDLKSIQIIGTVENAVDPAATNVRVFLKLWSDNLSEDGKFKRSLYPDLTQVRVEIQAPGNEPETTGLDVEASEVGSQHVAKFGPVKLKKVGVEPQKGDIETPAPGVTLPSVAAANGFEGATR